jgi:hypothetical protein
MCDLIVIFVIGEVLTGGIGDDAGAEAAASAF